MRPGCIARTARALAIVAIVTACSKDPLADNQRPPIQASTSDADPPYQDPSIVDAWTDVSIYDGEFGGAPAAAVRAYTQFIGNVVSHETSITETVDGNQPAPSRRFNEQQHLWWQPIITKDYTSHFFQDLARGCGVSVHAETNHDVTWENPLPSSWSNITFPHAMKGTFGNGSAAPCTPCGPPPPPPPNDQSAPFQPAATDCPPPGGGGGGSGGSGYYVTVTTCWGYHVYQNGVYQYSVIEDCEQYTYFVNME